MKGGTTKVLYRVHNEKGKEGERHVDDVHALVLNSFETKYG